MDRNTLLAFVLSMGVIALYLMYEANFAPPPAENDALQQEATTGYDALDSGFRADEPEERNGYDARYKDDAGSLAAERGLGEGALRDGGIEAPNALRNEPSPWEGEFGGELYQARLTNRGAGLIGWRLHGFSSVRRRGGEVEQIELVNLESADALRYDAGSVSSRLALRTSFRELGFGDLGDRRYAVVSETDSEVVFELEVGDISIRKTYDFDLDAYTFSLLVEVENNSDRVIAPEFQLEWPTVIVEGVDYEEQSLVALHGDEEVERELVGSVGSPGFFSGLFGGGSDADVVWRDAVWAGSDYKYFTALVLPDQPSVAIAEFHPLESAQGAVAVLRFEPVQLAPGSMGAQRVTGFLGPKDPILLESMGAQGQVLLPVVDLGYSWIEPLTRFFQWLLTAVYAFVPNYGLTIILITIMVRVVTLPIMNRQMRSMERMRALQPQLKALQAEHADDRQKQSEATMALYKETGVNPLGGCLPMLMQFPVFIGLFYALRSSFALRQAPFMLWIDDLSAPEALFEIPGIGLPLRVLPLIMGGSMFLQQKLTPMSVDPSQQMMMLFMMPIMMTVLFYQFPSGLVLYWMVSNFLGIAHQLLVGRRMKAAEK